MEEGTKIQIYWGKRHIYPRELSYSIKYPSNYDFVLFLLKIKILNLFLSELLVVNLFLSKLIIQNLETHRQRFQ